MAGGSLVKRIGPVLKVLLLLWISGVILAAFLYAPPDRNLGEAGRVIMFHIPVAWVTVLAFLVSCVYSVIFLRKRNLEDDLRAAASAQLGLVFAVLATVTGSIFARITWGSFWNWDPRETSIFILLLIYAAYFALRSAVEDEERKGRLSAVYAIVAFVTVPFLVFVVPRVYFSLHPDIITPTGKLEMGARTLQVFLASLAGFTGLYAWMYQLAVRIGQRRNETG
jgi:heme exporter protein C